MNSPLFVLPEKFTLLKDGVQFLYLASIDAAQAGNAEQFAKLSAYVERLSDVMNEATDYMVARAEEAHAHADAA